MPIPHDTIDPSAAPVLSQPSAPGPMDTGAAPVEHLLMAPGHPFVLGYHPDNQWQLEREGLEQATWLPRLQQLTCMPGVTGAKTLALFMLDWCGHDGGGSREG